MIIVDVKDIEAVSKKMVKASRSTFPVAVRSTLNDLAFDVKKNELGKSVVKAFDNLRNPSFFKAYSEVAKASGWKIERMSSTVGMSKKGNATKVIDRLEEQEKGGTLRSTMIPTDIARVGGLHKGKVLKNRWKGNVTKVQTVKYGDKQGLIRAVTRTGIKKGGKGKGNAVLYGNTLYEIKGFKRFYKGGKRGKISNDYIELHFDRIYTFKRSRRVKIKATHFVEKAAIISARDIQKIFSANMDKQFKRQGL